MLFACSLCKKAFENSFHLENSILAFSNKYNVYCLLETPETVWVKIPDEWKLTSFVEEDSSSISSENYPQPNSAESRLLGKGGFSEEQKNEPYFDHAMMTNLSEQVFSHAFLKCKVKNLGDRTVRIIKVFSWNDTFLSFGISGKQF